MLSQPRGLSGAPLLGHEAWMLLNKTDSDATQTQGQAPSGFCTSPWCLMGPSHYCLIYFVSVLGMAQAQGRGDTEGQGLGEGSAWSWGSLAGVGGPGALAESPPCWAHSAPSVLSGLGAWSRDKEQPPEETKGNGQGVPAGRGGVCVWGGPPPCSENPGYLQE